MGEERGKKFHHDPMYEMEICRLEFKAQCLITPKMLISRFLPEKGRETRIKNIPCYYSII